MITFVIGDVHGSFTEFQGLLDAIEPDLRRDRLIMLGDYIDRGPDSYLVVNKLIELEQTFGKEHVVLLRGNHEQMAINYCENGSRFIFLSNGGEATVYDFDNNCDELQNYVEFFKSLRTCFEDEHFIYVHGGIRPGIKLADQSEQDLLWIREEFIMSSIIEEKTVVFGHTPTLSITGSSQAFVSKGRIGIDTGCIYGGFLSALEIVDGEVKNVHQVRSVMINKA